MKNNVRLWLLAVGLVMVACNGSAVAPTPEMSTQATIEPTARPALSAATPMVELPENGPGGTAADLDATFFDTPWQDRTLFQAGLISSEQAILSQLPGAPVYHMDLVIEESNTMVNGRQQLLYTNQEDIPLNEVYFHLFPNLLGGTIEITRALANGEPVVPTYESINNSEMRLPLSNALRPGEQIIIDLDFVTTVPVESGRNYGVFAYLEDILALAHFYPQVAVYDDEGWNVETPSEGGDVTYADVGFYLVRVTAKPDLVMATSGIEVSREETAEQQITTFAGGPMRDFYLAASDRYQVTSQTVGEVTVNSYAPAEYMLGSATALGYAINAIESYSNHFASYPFTELDIVTTPTLALGIEYPGIIANRLAIYGTGDSSSGTPNQILLESTTAHEVGHQWFYSLVGNDQLDEPWLDESLTQYATYLYFFDQYGQAGAQGFHQSLTGRWSNVDNADVPIGLPVSAYSGPEYGAIIYGRGPLFFEALAQTMGEEAFTTFLRDYTSIHKWGIATSDSLKEIAEAYCNCDLTPLFTEWVYEK